MPGSEGEGTPLPESSPEAILPRVLKAASQLNQAGLSPEQQAQAVNTVLGGVLGLHMQGELVRTASLCQLLQNKVFNADPAHQILSAALVAGIEDFSNANNAQAVQSLLELSVLLGINDPAKFPDLVSKLKEIEARNAQPQPAAGGAGGGGEGPPETPEEPEDEEDPDEPQPPEGFRRFRREELWSKEFTAKRLEVARELARLEGKKYKELYRDAENRKLLKDYYQYWKYLEAQDTKKSQDSKRFKPADLEEATITAAREQYEDQQLETIPKIDNQDPTAKLWADQYRERQNATIPNVDQIEEARKYLSRYFKEAKTIGILQAVDTELDSIVKEVQQGLDQNLSSGEILNGKQESYARSTEGTTGVNKRIEVAKELGKRAFNMARASNPKLAALEEVWEVYIDVALDKILSMIPGFTRPAEIEGGYRFEAERHSEFRKLEEAEGELYWRPTWSNYFTVYARTREQFDRVRETFIPWVRSLGKSPDELFPKIQGMRDALISAGQRAGPEMQAYSVEVKYEIEATIGSILADLFFELYDPPTGQKAWEIVTAKPDAVSRMLQLIRSSRGRVAPLVFRLSRDPRLELLHNPNGSRGQLDGAEADRNAIEMRSLQEHIISNLVIEALGISLKEYHPDDPEKRFSRKMYQRNLDEIVKFRSDEYFRNLYEGFDRKAQDELYQELSVEEPNELKPVELATLARLTMVRKMQKYLEEGGDPTEFKGAERALYTETSNAVHTAWELFGAMGEKAQRGGTVYLVDRDEEGRPFRDFISDYWARRACHFAENWAKATYGGKLDQEMQNKLRADGWIHPNPTGLFASELFYKVGQMRRFAIWQMKADGREAKLWDFTLLRNGKPVDINSLGYTIYGENRDTEDPIDRYRYAVPVNERIIGYNFRGDPVVLVFDDNGKPKTLQYASEGQVQAFVFDNKGRPTNRSISVDHTTANLTTGLKVDFEYDDQGNAVIFNSPAIVQEWSEEQEKLIWKIVPPQDRKRIIFDNLNRNSKAEQILLNTPAGTIDPSSGKLFFDHVEKKPIDFDAIMFDEDVSVHPYCGAELSPYPGYQEEWTGLMLRKPTFAAAEAVKAGKLRPEDAPPHALHLLMVDPTLQRVGRFDVVSLEPVVVLAAQEESYQSEWLIGDELFLNFYPADASRPKNRTEYVLQDHGGSMKEWFHSRALAALWPDYRARRLRTFLPFISVDFGSWAKMYSALGGPFDVFRMMAYSKYKLIGQFASDKWVVQLHAAQKVLEAAIADWYNPQEEKLEESLGRKLNNEADTNLKQHYDLIRNKQVLGHQVTEDDWQKLLVSARAALGRLERLVHRNTVLQSLFRGDRAPLNLAGKEVYKRNKENGEYELDPKTNRMVLDDDVDKNRDSGASRHRNNLLIYRYAKFARSREYSLLYPDTAMYFAALDEDLADFPRLAKEAGIFGKLPKHTNGWDWINGKANN